MCFQYGNLQFQAEPKEAAAAFEAALQLKPDYTDARLQLGLLLTNQRIYLQAIGHLTQIRNITPDRANRLFSALAYNYSQSGDMEKARENAANAKKWAKTRREIEQADSMLRYLEPREKPVTRRNSTAASADPARPVLQHKERAEFQVVEQSPVNPFVGKEDKMSHVEGIAQKLDCGHESPRLHVLVNGKLMIFEIPDPERVVIKHSGEEKHDFACGAQKPYKVAVDYAILPDKTAGTAGIVRALEF
jgi:tetratricopeptide (TPR) repeat protein